MNYLKSLIITLLFFNCSNLFAQNIKDTINVFINLDQLDSIGLSIKVYFPSNVNEKELYVFPVSIPGIYEYLNNQQSRSNFRAVGNKNDSIPVIPAKENNYFPFNNKTADTYLTYKVSNTIDKFKGMSEKDTYYLKDSVYILNWHHLVGFVKDSNNFSYKINVNKNADLWGAGSLNKKILNDTTDIYIAGNYKELIHNPIMYSIPDTVSFNIAETKFSIAYAGSDTLLNSKKIAGLLIAPLTEILKHTQFKHKNYSFIYYSKYSLTAPYLTGLEHPRSTLICYHSALLDDKILISSSIHEFIHSVYAPLRIRSGVINNFDFISPKCDQFLWFYEGVTEYLAIKTLLNSGVFSNEDFLNELNLSNEYHKNINFSKTSAHIYDKKEQKLFNNFYTKGSLFALQLDVETMKRSNGKTNLFDVMEKLQKKYNPEIPFYTNSFIKEFSNISGVDIYSYINKNVTTKAKINFDEIINEIGYSLNEYKQDTLLWSFDSKKTFCIYNFKEDRLEYAFVGSTINKEQKCKKITIKGIDGEPLNWFNYEKLSSPKTEAELVLQANNGKRDILIKAKPKKILRKIKKTEWLKNENYETDLSKQFWNEKYVWQPVITAL
jgi:predicted metalloprotease with PDZ domain